MASREDILAEIERRKKIREYEKDKEENPLAFMTPTEGISAISTVVQEGARREMEKPPLEIAQDVILAPYRVVKAVGKGIAKEVGDVIEDPRNALGVAGQTVGTAAGALTGNPALMIAGSIGGRALGEAAEAYIFNRPFISAETVANTLGASTGSITGQLAGGVARGALRDAGKLSDKVISAKNLKVGMESPLAPTIIERPELPQTPGEDVIRQQTITDLAARQDAYLKELADDGMTSTVYAAPRISPGQAAQKSVADVVKFMVNDGHDIQTATRIALIQEIKTREKLTEVQRIAQLGPDEPKELLRLKDELKRIEDNLTGGAGKTTKAQQKFQIGLNAEASLATKMARINDDTLASIPDSLFADYDTFRRVTEVMPEAVKSPWIKAIADQGLGVLRKVRGLQGVLRQNGDPHLTHIADSLVSADETHKNLVQTFTLKSRKFFTDNPLSDKDRVYLQTLENDQVLYRALNELSGPMQDSAQVVQSLKTILPARSIDVSEIPDLLRATGIIRAWQREVGDPLYTMALGLAKDAGTVPPVRPSYFTSTFTHRDTLDTLTTDLANITKLAKQHTGTPLGERYQQSADILANKIAVANKAIERESRRLRNWKYVLDGNEAPLPKKLMAAELTPKKTEQGIGLNIEEASERYVHNMSKKMVYDRLLQTGDETTRAFMKNAIDSGADVNTVHSTARFVQNALLDQVGTRRAISWQRIKDRLSVNKTMATHVVPHLEKRMQDIMQGHYLLNIAWKPSFLGANLLQNFLTLMPIVDTESFAHGVFYAATNWQKARQEALEAGALSEGLNALWKDSDRSTVLSQTVDKYNLGGIAQKTEDINRVIAYHAGKKNAEIAGIRGLEADKKALDIVTQSNFLQSAAHRPQAVNTPIPAALLKYKSFAMNYGSFMGNLWRKGEYDKLAAALAASFAVGGTSGIPFYSQVQTALAQQGIVLPDVEPLDQVTGVELQGADPPWPVSLLPTSAKDVAGPILGIGASAVKAAYTGDAYDAAQVVKQVVGSGIVGSVAQGVAEISRGGVTRGQGGKVKSVRDPEQIALAMMGLGPGRGKLNYDARRKLSLAAASKDRDAIRNAVRETRAKGVRNQAQILANARAKVRKGETDSIYGELFGY